MCSRKCDRPLVFARLVARAGAHVETDRGPVQMRRLDREQAQPVRQRAIGRRDRAAFSERDSAFIAVNLLDICRRKSRPIYKTLFRSKGERNIGVAIL